MPKLYTIGYPAKTLHEFLEILHKYQITDIGDAYYSNVMHPSLFKFIIYERLMG